MKRIVFLAYLCGALTACNQSEQQAAQRLQMAREAYEQGLYSEAKLQIDSIKLLYPKAFDVRREGIGLMQEVELAEQTQSLAYLDSLLQVKQSELEAICSRCTLEKNEEYERIGHYLHPSQVIEKNLHRSFVRFRTDEEGKLSTTSIYCGARSIHHTAVRISAPDGTFAETPASTDSYETTDLGEKIEKADYKPGQDGGLIDFVCLNQKQNLKLTFLGEQNYTTTLTPADRQAAVTIRELSNMLASMTEIRKNMEECRLKMEFVKKKMAERKEKESF